MYEMAAGHMSLDIVVDDHAVCMRWCGVSLVVDSPVQIIYHQNNFIVKINESNIIFSPV